MVGRIGSWKGSISLEYRYTAGVAGERFLSELKKGGRLMASHCDACDVTYLPPRIYCERCLAPLEKWVEVKGPATLYSYTVTHARGKAFVIGLAKFKGVEGGILAPVAPSKVKLKIGAPVKVVNSHGTLGISL